MPVKIITNTDPKKGATTLNCNPNLTHYCIPVHTPEWYDFRYTGIEGVYDGGFGASEIYKVLRVEKEDYAPVLPQLMEYKAGIGQPVNELNEAMLWGILNEPTILYAWKRYDGTDTGYVANYLANEIRRLCEPVNAYIVNKKFPWLFVSLDSKINKGQSNLEGVMLTKDSPLECKTMNQMSYDTMIKSGVLLPNRYVYQCQQQMVVTETDYAEVPILIGGNKFRVEYLKYSSEIGETIVEESKDAWIIVLKLRKMRIEREELKAAEKWGLVEQVDSEIQSLLPLPGAGEAYDPYYESKYLETGVVVKGNIEHFEHIRKRNIINQLLKMLDEKKDEVDNIFRREFIRLGADIIDFNALGKVRYVKQKNWANHAPDFKGIKEKTDAQEMRKLFNAVMQILDK